MSSTLRDLCDEAVQLDEAQQRDDEAHDEYRARRKERLARRKELRATIGALMAENDLETFEAGGRVFTRNVRPTVKITKRLVESFLGPDGFGDYAERNVSFEDRVQIK